MLELLITIYTLTWLTTDLIPTLLWAAAITATAWTAVEAIRLHRAASIDTLGGLR